MENPKLDPEKFVATRLVLEAVVMVMKHSGMSHEMAASAASVLVMEAAEEVMMLKLETAAGE